MNASLGEKIKLARKRAGLSLRGLAEKMNLLVTAQAIGKYERGEMTPSSEVLIEICRTLDVKLSFLLASGSVRLEKIDFRKSHTNKKDLAKVESEVVDAIERYLEIEEILELSHSSINDLREFANGNNALNKNSGETLADGLRKHWKLGLDPIPNLTELLEEKRIKVLLISIPDNVSGLTATVSKNANEKLPVIVLNRSHSLERRRFTLAHELCHLIVNVLGYSHSNYKELESFCNCFAGAFLVNGENLKKELGENRTSIGYSELVNIKKYYGVSAAALLMRLEQIGVISNATKINLFRTVAKDWLKVEPSPIEKDGKEEHEKPTRFERLVYRALSEDMISISKATELLKINSKKIMEGLKGPVTSEKNIN